MWIPVVTWRFFAKAFCNRQWIIKKQESKIRNGHSAIRYLGDPEEWCLRIGSKWHDRGDIVTSHEKSSLSMETDRTSRSSASRSWQRGSYRGRGGRRRKRKRKPWGERIVDWTRALIAFLFSNVGIVCLVVGYTIAGAFLFTHIEGRTSLNVAGDVIKLRNLTAATLWELTSKVKNLHELNYALRSSAAVELSNITNGEIYAEISGLLQVLLPLLSNIFRFYLSLPKVKEFKGKN